MRNQSALRAGPAGVGARAGRGGQARLAKLRWMEGSSPAALVTEQQGFKLLEVDLVEERLQHSMVALVHSACGDGIACGTSHVPLARRWPRTLDDGSVPKASKKSPPMDAMWG